MESKEEYAYQNLMILPTGIVKIGVLAEFITQSKGEGAQLVRLELIPNHDKTIKIQAIRHFTNEELKENRIKELKEELALLTGNKEID